MSKVAVIGSGLVGATTTHTLALRGSCEEVVLLDTDREKAQAQAVEVAAAATLLRGMRVYSGTYEQIADAQVVVLAAGVRQRSGQSRSELFAGNTRVFQEVLSQVLEVAPEAVILVAAQPVDPLTELTWRLASRRQAAQVLGVGTVLETMQLRAAVAAHLEVSPEHVHGYVIGEQGDSALVVWSNLSVAGLPVEEFAAQRGKTWTLQDRASITDRVQRSNRRVVEGKGAIAYGVGVAVTRVIEAILRDAQMVLTVSAHQPDKGISYSLPRLVGARGVTATINPMLSQEEAFKLEVLLNGMKSTFELA
jgi:L-lactate dehydrogenase